MNNSINTKSLPALTKIIESTADSLIGLLDKIDTENSFEQVDDLFNKDYANIMKFYRYGHEDIKFDDSYKIALENLNKSIDTYFKKKAELYFKNFENINKIILEKLRDLKRVGPWNRFLYHIGFRTKISSEDLMGIMYPGIFEYTSLANSFLELNEIRKYSKPLAVKFGIETTNFEIENKTNSYVLNGTLNPNFRQQAIEAVEFFFSIDHKEIYTDICYKIYQNSYKTWDIGNNLILKKLNRSDFNIINSQELASFRNSIETLRSDFQDLTNAYEKKPIPEFLINIDNMFKNEKHFEKDFDELINIQRILTYLSSSYFYDLHVINLTLFQRINYAFNLDYRLYESIININIIAISLLSYFFGSPNVQYYMCKILFVLIFSITLPILRNLISLFTIEYNKSKEDCLMSVKIPNKKINPTQEKIPYYERTLYLITHGIDILIVLVGLLGSLTILNTSNPLFVITMVYTLETVDVFTKPRLYTFKLDYKELFSYKAFRAYMHYIIILLLILQMLGSTEENTLYFIFMIIQIILYLILIISMIDLKAITKRAVIKAICVVIAITTVVSVVFYLKEEIYEMIQNYREI